MCRHGLDHIKKIIMKDICKCDDDNYVFQAQVSIVVVRTFLLLIKLCNLIAK